MRPATYDGETHDEGPETSHGMLLDSILARVEMSASSSCVRNPPSPSFSTHPQALVVLSILGLISTCHELWCLQNLRMEHVWLLAIVPAQRGSPVFVDHNVLVVHRRQCVVGIVVKQQ